MDSFHVACALEWRADLFVTADKRQLSAAKNAGLLTERIRRIFLSLSVFCLLFIMTACGGYQTKNYEGPELGDDKVSIITTDDQFVTIKAIDGQKTLDTTNVKNVTNALLWGRNPRTVSILPGKHQILPCWENPYERVCAESWLTIETEPGKIYIIRHERRSDKKIGFWSEEKKKENKIKE